MNKPITKAVFPVAGLGTRFLPATKASPKEMLPIIDRPIIQFAVEEAIEAGITDMVFVTGRTKRSIEDHFDRSVELEQELMARQQHDVLDEVQSVLPSNVNCVYIRQPKPLGLGHAVLCARSVIGDNPFAVLLPDDLMHGKERGCIAQMADAFARLGSSLLAVENVPRSMTGKYGIVSANKTDGDCFPIDALVEKPDPHDAPSTLAVVGRYVLSPAIFGYLQTQAPGAGGEIQLTDAIARLIEREPVHAFRFQGQRFDCGSKLGFLEATVHYALGRDDLADDFRTVLSRYGH